MGVTRLGPRRIPRTPDYIQGIPCEAHCDRSLSPSNLPGSLWFQVPFWEFDRGSRLGRTRNQECLALAYLVDCMHSFETRVLWLRSSTRSRGAKGCRDPRGCTIPRPTGPSATCTIANGAEPVGRPAAGSLATRVHHHAGVGDESSTNCTPASPSNLRGDPTT